MHLKMQLQNSIHALMGQLCLIDLKIVVVKHILFGEHFVMVHILLLD